MTAQWTADQSMWPAHLRDNAPSQKCGRCGRTTYSPSDFDAECRMTQPDGFPCGGRFESPGVLLDLYAAKVGAPVPTDTTTPLHEDYTRVGKGWVRLAHQEPQEISDLITRTVAGKPHLLIRWVELNFDWQSPDVWGPVKMNTLIGQGTTPDGQAVRMVARRAGRAEYEQHRDHVTATVELHTGGPYGGAVTWYRRP